MIESQTVDVFPLLCVMYLVMANESSELLPQLFSSVLSVKVKSLSMHKVCMNDSLVESC
jgi:hypothetical protein